MPKKYFIIILSSLIFSGLLRAQVKISDLRRNCSTYNEWGVFAGANYQQLFAFPFERQYNPGAVIGVYVKKRVNMLGLQSGLYISSAHYETEFLVAHKYRYSAGTSTDTEHKGIFDALYINLPIIAELRPKKRFSFQMGVEYSYLCYLNDKNGAYSKTADPGKLFKKSNVNLLAGAEFEMSKRLKVAASYHLGLLDVNGQGFQGLTDYWVTSSGQLRLIYQVNKWYGW